MLQMRLPAIWRSSLKPSNEPRPGREKPTGTGKSRPAPNGIRTSRRVHNLLPGYSSLTLPGSITSIHSNGFICKTGFEKHVYPRYPYGTCRSALSVHRTSDHQWRSQANEAWWYISSCPMPKTKHTDIRQATKTDAPTLPST
jgi:hypothetical protein